MKTALIVDDSRVARAVLRKMLVDFGLQVDEVPTAEAAIEYLKVDSPDIIFLDHMMPGMDGFDALAALKANPSTAMIPVLMYTTQEGQFYAGQARALGAVDVLPKTVAPADIERILRSHHLIGESSVEAGLPLDEPAVLELDADGELIERFRQMLDARAATLMTEFRRELKRSQAATETGMHRLVEELKPEARRAFSGRVAAGLGVAVIALAVAVPYLPDEPPAGRVSTPSDAVTEQAEMTRLVDAVAATGRREIPTVMVPPAASATSAATAISASELVRVAERQAVSWSATQPYAYGGVPLDDVRAREYALLFARLKSEGFVGSVTFDVYQGRHCLHYAVDGSTQLAAPDQPAATCDHIGTSGSIVPLQSPMFESMIASATRDGQIAVETVFHGTDDPIIDYPVLDYELTAGDWNAIAAINQRVSMRVIGEGAAAAGESMAYTSY